jgi:hypothetical protein
MEPYRREVLEFEKELHKKMVSSDLDRCYYGKTINDFLVLAAIRMIVMANCTDRIAQQFETDLIEKAWFFSCQAELDLVRNEMWKLTQKYSKDMEELLERHRVKSKDVSTFHLPNKDK